ncbi:hypothetical protein Tter_2463 [Thermobaculum terrenum ATCC BAA-798]|uniref:Uncharacterized protein n=1 Tax=Thermobaculum terrenum (strain ATCC BAA-798 / CCMEE 7001 / YNP1) TaxID=525904 RepID=D1CHY5_THET1|nr:hypothetical protein [Thermobaculum terrenum]ACZ43356.1 hypothetical protein Tter_2463 [Thermobaculum terrenum ATCC BAA-798]
MVAREVRPEPSRCQGARGLRLYVAISPSHGWQEAYAGWRSEGLWMLDLPVHAPPLLPTTHRLVPKLPAFQPVVVHRAGSVVWLQLRDL